MKIIYLFTILLIVYTPVSLSKGVQLPNGVVIQDYYEPINIDYLNKVTGAHVRKAEKRFKEGKYEWVKTDIHYTLYRVPNHPEALQMYSVLSFNKQQRLITPKQVISAFEKAIEYTPRQPNSYVLFGIHLHKMGDYNNAIKQYTLALEYSPDNTEAHYNVGLAYFEIENYEKSKMHAKSAYENGFPLNGLKNKLRSVKYWP